MKYPNITLGRVEAVWNRLGGETGVQSILDRNSYVVVSKNVIDCDAQPWQPDYYNTGPDRQVEVHHKGGQLRWNPSQVGLYKNRGQFMEASYDYSGEMLLRDMADDNIRPMNACVLDFLLGNQHLIPEEWRSCVVYFWGTIYKEESFRIGESDKHYVRDMFWNGLCWEHSFTCIEDLKEDGLTPECVAAYLK